MTKSALLTSTAVALFLGLAPANAQMQQKEEKSAPSQMQQERSQQEKGPSSSQGTQAQESQGKASKESAEKAEPNEKATKGSAQKDTQPKEKSTKGTAERSAPKDKASKGTAERSDRKDSGTAEKQSQPQDRKGTAEKSTGQPKDNATKGTAGREAPSGDKAAGAERSGSSQRVQLTEEKRTNIHQTILRERNVNRVTNVNFSINVGTRVPRSVRLEVLPASVITIVPEYRSYRYFVVDDQICIVEPSTYEIVEVIRVSDRTAGRDSRGTSAALMLTEREKEILLRDVDLRSGSTLALGALTEGADVPRDVSLRTFSAAVVEQVPKVRDYKYVTAENRLAIVDPRGSKVELVIEDRR